MANKHRKLGELVTPRRRRYMPSKAEWQKVMGQAAKRH